MKKLRNIVFSLLLILTLTSTAFADNVVTREYTFTTTDKNFKYTKNQEITIGRDKYKIKDIEYEVISSKKEKVNKKFKNLAEKKVPGTLKDNGKNLKLLDATFEGRVLTETVKFEGYVNKPSIPESKTFEKDGFSFVGNLVSTERVVSETYNTPFSVPAKFYGDPDVKFYRFHGMRIPANSTPNFNGYKGDVLRYNNLDGGLYRIDGGKWSSGFYKAGNETVRNATYYGMRKTNTYIATYSGTVYDANAIYEVENGVKTSKVKAIVTYELQGMSFKTKLILAGVGIVVFAVLIAIILTILKRRRKKK